MNLATRYNRNMALYHTFLIDRRHFEFLTTSPDDQIPMGMYLLNGNAIKAFMQLNKLFNSVLIFPGNFDIQRIEWRGPYLPDVLSHHSISIDTSSPEQNLKSYVDQLAVNLDFEWTFVRFEFRRSGLHLEFQGSPIFQRDPIFSLRYLKGDYCP